MDVQARRWRAHARGCGDLWRSLRAGVDPDGVMRECADRTDPFALVFPGMGRVHFVATPEGAREILTLPGDILCAPTPNPIEPIVGPSSVILTSGDVHRRQRKHLSPAFRGSQVRERAELIAEAVRAETRLWRGGDRIPLHHVSQTITKRIIIQTVLGVAPGHRSDTFEHVVSELLDANTAPLMLLPALRREFAGRGPWTRLLKQRGRFNELLAEQISRGRRSTATVDGTVLGRLLTDAYRSAHDDEELLEQLRTLLVAGHDTTASALAWALDHIHRDDRVRDRLTAELAEDAAAEDMPKLPYLSSVIFETLRMHPSVPVVMRKLAEPRHVLGRRFQTGDIIGIAVPALHFNPAIWQHPERFDPQRFLDRTPTPFEYVPFGGGYRRCPGAAFAHTELAIAIGTIMCDAVLTVPRSARARRPPRAVPRGIATVPRREMILDVGSIRGEETFRSSVKTACEAR